MLFHVFHHFILNCFNIFVGIHHPLNRGRRSNIFKATLWCRDSRVVISNGGGILQHDLASCHTAKKVTTTFEENHIKILDRSGNSPSLNPIENLWSIVKIRLLKRDCTTKTKLIDAVINVWYVTKKLLRTAKNS